MLGPRASNCCRDIFSSLSASQVFYPTLIFFIFMNVPMDALDLGSEKIAEQSYQSIRKGKKWKEEIGKSRWRGMWREGVRGGRQIDSTRREDDNKRL